MKLTLLPLLSVLILTTLTFIKPAYASIEKFAANFSFATCVRHAGDERTLSNLFQKKGINQLTPKFADQFLNGNKGKAWSFTAPNGQYAITFQKNGVCTVFVKKANAGKFISEVNVNLARINKNVGWSFSPSKVPNFAGKTELESFNVTGQSKEGKKVNIILSATYQTTGSYQIALSSAVM